jgi:HEAT repeat protein
MHTDPARAFQRARELSEVPGEGAEEEYWTIVAELHGSPTQEVFDQCLSLCVSADPRDRVLGANVLAQLGYAPHFPFRESSIPALEALLDDPSALVVRSCLAALTHLDRVPIDRAVAYATHEESSIRQAVACALSGKTDDLSVATLIELSRDPVPCVRDWSTFGLGSLTELDTPALRSALLDRLDDPDAETCAEAISALARRRDLRVLEPLRRMLLEGLPSAIVLEAVEALGSKELLPDLERLRARWKGSAEILESAIRSCEGKADAASG